MDHVVHLSKREQDVLILMGKGCTNKEIGRLLTLSTNTIGDYTKRLYHRLGVNNRTEAAVWAAKEGML